MNVYTNTEAELAKIYAERFRQFVDRNIQGYNPINVLLPGSNIPEAVFTYLSRYYASKINWHCIHFFWTDEGFNTYDQEYSGYQIINQQLFQNIPIPYYNIHPIVVENHPFLEADRYTTVINKHFQIFRDIPSFDWVMLSLGEDGELGSMFPEDIDMFYSNRLYEVVTNPKTKQTHISVTGKVLNWAKHITIFATGKEKADIVKTIFNRQNKYAKKPFPAELINPYEGSLEWYVDYEAATHIKDDLDHNS